MNPKYHALKVSPSIVAALTNEELARFALRLLLHKPVSSDPAYSKVKVLFTTDDGEGCDPGVFNVFISEAKERLWVDDHAEPLSICDR